MKFLVIGLPKHPIPPEQLPMVTDGALAWHQRYEQKFGSFGVFPGGGGFGTVEVADEKELNQLIIEMPFSWFSEITVRPYVEGAAGFEQLKTAVDSMAAAIA
jgi:hypothetical protein